MKQFTRPGWLGAIIISCLASTTAYTYPKAIKQLSSSFDFYLLGIRAGVRDLN